MTNEGIPVGIMEANFTYYHSMIMIGMKQIIAEIENGENND